MMMNKSILCSLLLIVLLGMVQGESVAELRRLRALGYGTGSGHHYGGDNGRDHPQNYPQNPPEQQQQAQETAATSSTATASMMEESNGGEELVDSKLSAGALAGILIAALCVLLLPIFAYLFMRRNTSDSVPVPTKVADAEDGTHASDTSSEK